MGEGMTELMRTVLIRRWRSCKCCSSYKTRRGWDIKRKRSSKGSGRDASYKRWLGRNKPKRYAKRNKTTSQSNLRNMFLVEQWAKIRETKPSTYSRKKASYPTQTSGRNTKASPLLSKIKLDLCQNLNYYRKRPKDQPANSIISTRVQ